MTHASMNLLDMLFGNVMDESRGNGGDESESNGFPPEHEHNDGDVDRLMDPDKKFQMFGSGGVRVFCIDLQSQLHVYCDKDNILTAQLVTPIKPRLSNKPAQYRAPAPSSYKAPQAAQTKAAGLPTNGDYSEMARTLGVDPSYVSYIMAGKRRPSLELFFKMADHLHMKPEELQRKLEDLWAKAHPGKK